MAPAYAARNKEEVQKQRTDTTNALSRAAKGDEGIVVIALSLDTKGDDGQVSTRQLSMKYTQ